MDMENGQSWTDEPDGNGPPRTIEAILADLLCYEEVLAAVAISRDGLVVGSAGIDEDDAEVVGVVAAPLVGAADLTTRRLGGGNAAGVSVEAGQGTLHIRSGGDFAVVMFSEQADLALAAEACGQAVKDIAVLLQTA